MKKSFTPPLFLKGDIDELKDIIEFETKEFEYNLNSISAERKNNFLILFSVYRKVKVKPNG